jgi:hypothetical protein
MNFTRSQLSLLLTLLLLGILVMVMVNIKLSADLEEEYVIELEVVVDESEEAMAEKEEITPENASSSIASHQAYNEMAQASYAQPEPLKTLEELMAEAQFSASGEPIGDTDSFGDQLRKINEKRNENKQKIEAQESDKQTYTDALKDRRTSVSYSLVERNARDLPPPIYTCLEGGKVVINIEVDSRGFVLQARLNEKSSTTTNGCLIDNALAYALKSRFNNSVRSTQIGTITYVFQGK